MAGRWLLGWGPLVASAGLVGCFQAAAGAGVVIDSSGQVALRSHGDFTPVAGSDARVRDAFGGRLALEVGWRGVAVTPSALATLDVGPGVDGASLLRVQAQTGWRWFWNYSGERTDALDFGLGLGHTPELTVRKDGSDYQYSRILLSGPSYDALLGFSLTRGPERRFVFGELRAYGGVSTMYESKEPGGEHVAP